MQKAGYREGITAGKESALQEGFDDGFASTGAPLGRELGILRGLCSALLAFLSRSSPSTPPLSPLSPDIPALIDDVRAIAAQLAEVRLSDIAPPDAQAVAHAREHLADAAMAVDSADDDEADPAALNEDIRDKRDMEGLEDLMARMGAGTTAAAAPARPTPQDVTRLRERLLGIARGLGLELQWS